MTIRQSVKNFIYDNFGVGENPHRIVHCLITTEHGMVVDEKLSAVSGYVLDEKYSQAFLLDHASEVPMQNSQDHVLILDERDAYPYLAGKKSKGKRDEWAGTINQISANAWATQKGEVELKLNRDKQQMIILLTFVVVAIVLVLIILLGYVSTLL